jgi:hypothetical protein
MDGTGLAPVSFEQLQLEALELAQELGATDGIEGPPNVDGAEDAAHGGEMATVAAARRRCLPDFVIGDLQPVAHG